MSRLPGGNFKTKLLFFSSYTCSPIQIGALKTCNQDNTKSITARGFKLGQLIKDNE